MNLTTQQQLALEQTRNLYNEVNRTGEHLDGKANAIIQAGGLIVAVTGATALPSLATAAAPLPVLAGLAVAFVIFIAMIWCAVTAWRPVNHELAGSANWNNVFDLYISREADDAYNQVLQNLIESATTNRAANERKARYVTAAAWLLALQVAGILALAVAAALL